MRKVFAYVHTHWDREWYREFEEFRLRLIDVIDDVINKLDNKEIPAFYFDGQTAALEDYLEIKPEKSNKIKDLIKQKKLFIGPYYCSTDSFLIDAESIIKNLQIGIKTSKEFGCNEFIAYHADTFGHSRYIPEIIKYFNIDNAIFWRGLGELPSEFLFRGLYSTYLIEGYFHDYFNTQLPIEKKAEMLKRTLDRISEYSTEHILLPIGADHMACPDNLTEQLVEVSKHLNDYKIILTTPFEYLNAVRNYHELSLDKEFRDTTRNFILPGVNSSRIDLKQKNAKLQYDFARKIRPLNAISKIYGNSNYENTIEYAYKELIKNHPHDSIYGCSVDNVHKENNIRFDKVKSTKNAVLNSIKQSFENNNNKTFSVINLSNFVYNGSIKIQTTNKLNKSFNAQLIHKQKGFPQQKLYDINQVPISEDYTEIYEYLLDVKGLEPFTSNNVKTKLNHSQELFISQNSIENAYVKLKVENNKVIVYDKVHNEIYKDFIRIIDRADIGDSYNFGALKSDKLINARIVNTKIKEKGHIRSILEITYEIFIPNTSKDSGRTKKTNRHIIKLNVILENQNNYLEFKANWINKSTNHITQISIKLPDTICNTVSDDLTGYIERKFDPNYNIYEHIPAPRGIELKHNTAPLQKFVMAQNVTVITEGLQEYEIDKNNLNLTILRATGTISNPVNPTRGTPAGPPLPTPDLQMLKENNFRFAIQFEKNIKNIESSVEKFYESYFTVNSDVNIDKLFTSGNENIYVSTIKTQNGDIIIRFINKNETQEHIRFRTNIENNGIYITNAMEEILEKYKDTLIQPNSFITILIKK